MKTSYLSADNFKKISTSMDRHLSPRYGQVILVSGYPVLITKFSGMGRFTYPWCSAGALRAPELRYNLSNSGKHVISSEAVMHIARVCKRLPRSQIQFRVSRSFRPRALANLRSKIPIWIRRKEHTLSMGLCSVSASRT